MSWSKKIVRRARGTCARVVERREFLANTAMGLALVPGVALVAHYVLTFLAPGTAERREEILLGKVSEIPVNGSRPVRDVLGNDLIAVRHAGGEMRVLSSTCTHLGCRVEWDAARGTFLCPCHQGRFDRDGQVLEGPPTEPLPAYPVRIDGDNLFVTLPVRNA